MKVPGLIALLVVSSFFFPAEPFYFWEKGSTEQDSLITISVAVVGDLMCHSVQFNYAQVSADSFDFNPVYKYVTGEIASADFAFGNLETVTAGRKSGYSGYPFFNTPDEFVSALKNAGFDFLTTSNNHSLDRGEAGILRTIEQITSNRMGYNGTFKNQSDRDSIRIYNINGILIAFLAYSYGTNGIPVPQGKDYLINLIDTVLIRKDIISAHEKNPDLILVHFHFGEEYKRQPSSSQRDIVNKTIEYGADIIIGGHPHVLQPIEFIKGYRNLDSVFVVYSLGNFISNQRWRYSDSGAILKLSISKNYTSGKINLDSVHVTPTWVYRGRTKNKDKEFVIIPSTAADSIDITLSKEDSDKMNKAFRDTREMFLIN